MGEGHTIPNQNTGEILRQNVRKNMESIDNPAINMKMGSKIHTEKVDTKETSLMDDRYLLQEKKNWKGNDNLERT